nr:tetraspanin-8 isoform X2 [Pogona vitticeps]
MGVDTCIKYSIFVFNVVFLISGCVILGMSIWMRVSKPAQVEFNIDRSLFAVIELLIAVGCIIMVLGFLGCCGAVQESECMLLLFFIGLLAILLLQIVAGILGALFKPQIEETLDKTFAENAAKLSGSAQMDREFQAIFRKFEINHKCCGLVKGQADWGPNEGCTCAPEDQDTSFCEKSIYVQFCRDILVKFFKENMVIVMGLAFGLAFLEALGMVFSMILYCQIQRRF